MENFLLILAGGKGNRLWPISTDKLPKQFINLYGNEIMINETIRRVENIFKYENIFVIINEEQFEIAERYIDAKIPRKNIITEPKARNTAMCIFLATLKIKKMKGDGVISILSSDHYIEDNNKLQKDLLNAIEVAKTEENIVTIGITPTYPATGFGYIKYDKFKDNIDYYLVNEFKEKPNYDKAIEFINKNANSFIGSTGNYIHEHLVSEYNLNPQKAIFVINGEIMFRETVYEETDEMKSLFDEIKDYDSMVLSFARAEEYKNLEATMHLGKELGIKPVVIAQSYFPGQPIIKQYETTASNTGAKLFIDVPFHFPQYILKHYAKPLVMLIPSKKEIVGLIVNETRKLNKDNVLVVANDIGGLHEQIEDGKDGVLVDLENIVGSADKISKYLNIDSIREMNASAQARLKEMYDFEKICTAFLKTLLGGKYDECFIT